MKLLFLLPDIQDVPTGGNIYNTKMMQMLRAGCTVHQAVWRQGMSIQALLAPAYDWVFIDSLLVDQIAVSEIKARTGAGTRWAVLVHYLPFFDPHHAAAQTDAEVAGLLAYDLFVTTSAYSKQCLAEAGLPAEHIVVVYPGLDSDFRASGPIQQDEERINLLTVSSLLPGKGLLPYIDLLERLIVEGVDWRWQLIGDDALDTVHAAAVFARMKASPMAARMSWCGAMAQQQMPAQYREASLFVLPSRFETLGMAAREAMAAGLPVVAFDVGGVRESLSDGAGVLVAPFDYDRMLQHLLRLLANPMARKRLGENAHARSRQFPSWEDSADTLMGQLQQR